MARQHALHVQGLEKSFNGLEVLRGADFDVARGSIFALLGSNGAGKTTVVRSLSTLLRADAGTASVNDFDVATQAADVPAWLELPTNYGNVRNELHAASAPEPSEEAVKTRARTGYGDITIHRSLETRAAADL
ncbi:ATP-binding cassette domain-containing protein [Sorangium sp. So ce124]